MSAELPTEILVQVVLHPHKVYMIDIFNLYATPEMHGSNVGRPARPFSSRKELPRFRSPRQRILRRRAHFVFPVTISIFPRDEKGF